MTIEEQKTQIEDLTLCVMKLENDIRNLRSEMNYKFIEKDRYAELCRTNHEEVHEDLLKIMNDFKESIDEMYQTINGKIKEDEDEEDDDEGYDNQQPL